MASTIILLGGRGALLKALSEIFRMMINKIASKVNPVFPLTLPSPLGGEVADAPEL